MQTVNGDIGAPINPFGLMLDPQVAMQALARLDQATQKTKRVCRPLDKPTVAKEGDTSAFDKRIDSEPSFD